MRPGSASRGRSRGSGRNAAHGPAPRATGATNGPICSGRSARSRSTGAAIIMPEVNIEATDEHLAEISRHVSVGAIALLVLDGAGWHSSPQLKVPDNIVLLPLPPYAPELNPVENVWEFLRANFLSHRVWDTVSDDPDGDRHAEPGHPVKNVTSNLRLGSLIGQNSGVKAPADDGLVAIHCGFGQAPAIVA